MGSRARQNLGEPHSGSWSVAPSSWVGAGRAQELRREGEPDLLRGTRAVPERQLALVLWTLLRCPLPPRPPLVVDVLVDVLVVPCSHYL